MRLRTARRQPRRGAAAVEASVVLSLLFVLMFGIFEYGRFLMVYNLCEYAAREGARLASTQFVAGRSAAQLAAETQQIIDFTKAALGGVDNQLQSGADVSVMWADPATGANRGAWYNAPYGDPIAVRVTGTYRPMFSLIIASDVTITVQSTTGNEAN
jgi:Flp pilus assembly protein TadG